jgi:hypothetical protein
MSATTDSASSPSAEKYSNDEILPMKNYEFNLDTSKDYLSNKLRTATVCGLLTGAARGYYVGELALTYAFTHGLGFGLASTSFFIGTYILKNVRKTDDVANYSVMGFIQGGGLATALHGVRKGLMGGGIGAVIGISLKFAMDGLYENSRILWLQHRKRETENPQHIDYRFYKTGFPQFRSSANKESK